MMRFELLHQIANQARPVGLFAAGFGRQVDQRSAHTVPVSLGNCSFELTAKTILLRARARQNRMQCLEFPLGEGGNRRRA